MKKKLYNFLSLLLVLCACFSGFTQNVFAKEKEYEFQLSKTEAKSLKEKVDSLSDSEFDKFVLDYVRSNNNFEYSKQTMEQVGVTLNVIDEPQSSISIMSLDPSDYSTFVIYSAHRGYDKFTRILVNLIQDSWAATETNPGTLDVLSIEWDPTVAKYYSYTAGDYVTYRDGSKKANGIVVFNVEDKNMSYGSAAYAGVYVTPIVSGAEVEIGSKFTHTYTATSTTTESISIGFSMAGPTGGYTYTANSSTVNLTWDRYTDNAFIIQSY